jgi:signal-transduction protein with cAMP-binding, CBS, and nucleotidyltransferase domain
MEMPMRVGDMMNPVSAIIGPEHTLAQAAVKLVQNNTGAGIVIDPSLPGPAVFTERDLLRAVAAGLDPGTERVEDHMTSAIVTADQNWPLTQAASLMVRHGVRHVLVFDGASLVGVLSMRDVVKAGAIAPFSGVAESAGNSAG